MRSPISLFVTAFLGITAVGLGAFGAHALKARLAASGMTAVWETAVLYHLVHTVAVLAVSQATSAAGPGLPVNPWRDRAAGCWTAGVLLFSGSLYALALGGPRWLGPVTPLGGVLLILGWGCVALAARRGGASLPRS